MDDSKQTKELGGRTFLITGGNAGIGRATVEGLVARRASVVVASRSEEKTQPVLDAVRREHPEADVAFIQLDLGDLASVERGAQTFLASGRPLDVLINNAGLGGARGLSKDGYEITFATNHLGPFLLTERLLPKLHEAREARIVNVSSRAHEDARSIRWARLEQPATSIKETLIQYAVSKLMNVLHAKELARRLTGTNVTTYALHPGVVASDIWRRIPQPFRAIMKLFMISNEEGARTSLYCATAPELHNVSGRYYDKCQEAPTNPLANDEALAKELFTRSEEMIQRALKR